MRQYWTFAWLAIFPGCSQAQPKHVQDVDAHSAHAAAPASSSVVAGGRGMATVTVALIIDQFAAWVARDRLAFLPANGGFARLRREGTWYQDVRLEHALTETAPGHASLYSGKVPREHGIIANELWVRGHATAILADETTRTITAEGERPEFSSSLRSMNGDLVADRFRAQVPNARVYSFSLKDRGALFGGGRHPDLCLWYDGKLGRFASSTAFTQRLPDWVVPALGRAALQARLDRVWMPVRENVGAELRPVTNDAESGESDFAVYGAAFPHQPSHSTQPFGAFRANPESDTLLLELGVLAVENTPLDAPTLLAISLSANDYIGHLFGPDSWEAKDELFRLDAALAGFFAELDRLRGPGHWRIVLSADHGVLPLPELSQREARSFHEAGTQGTRPREVTFRVMPEKLLSSAREAATKALGRGDWVAAFLDPYLYLTDEAKQLPSSKVDKLGSSLRSELEKTPCTAQVFEIAKLPEVCPPFADDSLAALVCRSAQFGKGGEFYVALKPECFFDTGYVPGFGTSHGSSGLANRAIPLLVRAPGKIEAGKVHPGAQSFDLFARTLDDVLGIH